MTQRLVDIVRELGRKLASRPMTWSAALHAAAHEPLVDMVALRIAQVELGNDWAGEIYEMARSEASAVQPVDIFVDDVTLANDIMNTDRISTEPGTVSYITVNQLILKLAAMRDADQDVGAMRVVDPTGTDITSVNIEHCGGEGDDAFVVALR
jgi:hypothetical protein